jgi:hypothetical protein
MSKRALWGRSVSLYRALIGDPGGRGPFSVDFERNVKRALEIEHLAVRMGLHKGNMEGGISFSVDFERHIKRAV